MNLNVCNYSQYVASTTKRDDVSDHIRQHHGCNAFIRRTTEEYLYIIIPSELITEVLDEINKKNNTTYTLEDIINAFREMGFHYNYKLVEKKTTFLGITYDGYYVFELSKYSNKVTRYYAFCMIRHFYYYQNVLIDYMKFYPQYKNDTEKIISLYLASIHCVNTFMGTLCTEADTFKDVLSRFKYHNYPIERIQLVGKKFEYQSILDIAEVYNSIKSNVTVSDTLRSIVFDTSKLLLSNNKKLLSKSNTSISGTSYTAYVPKFELSPKKKVLVSPIKLNISKNALSSYNVLCMDDTYSINMDKTSRKENALNFYKVVNNLKKEKVLNTLCKQKEDVLGDYDIHYLFFSKRGLFLHQVQEPGCIIDSNFKDFDKYSISDAFMNHFHKIFLESNLDIGVITVKIHNDDYYVTEIKPFKNNGEYSLIKYINELKYVWSSRILSKEG